MMVGFAVALLRIDVRCRLPADTTALLSTGEFLYVDQMKIFDVSEPSQIVIC